MNALIVVPKPQPWMAQGVCRGVDPDLFFPDKFDHDTTEAAKAVCATCPVRERCLAYALDHNEKHGVWGGLTRTERRDLMKTRRAA